MIPNEAIQLWESYLAAERVRVRQESLAALDCFIDAVVRLPAESWHPWALESVRRVVDEGENIPVRMPLFRNVLFPALRTGLERSLPGSARWLAGFAQLLYQQASRSEELPENLRTEFGLVLRAIQDDPEDTRAKKHLRALMRFRFNYVLHELPMAVLYGYNGASKDQCDELMAELSHYERLAEELGLEDIDREQIAEARFHIPAYQRYLSDPNRNAGYKQYLAEHVHP